MRVAVLDDRVQPAQEVAVGARHVGRVQHVEDRLVVLVDQHHDPPAGAFVQRLQQMPETGRRGLAAGGNPKRPLQVAQPRRRLPRELAGFAEVTAAEAEADDGMADRPVPPVVNLKASEQGFGPLEQLLDGVEQQALAEPPRARQEVVLAPVDQSSDIGGLVDVVVALFADLAERLDADRQLAPHPAPVGVRIRPRHGSRSGAAHRTIVPSRRVPSRVTVSGEEAGRQGGFSAIPRCRARRRAARTPGRRRRSSTGPTPSAC